MRYLVKASLKPGKLPALLRAIEDRSLGSGSIAGDEYIANMRSARLTDDEKLHWVETCFCRIPLEEERPHWEEFLDLLEVRDAHSRRNCRHENGSEPWACCDCALHPQARGAPVEARAKFPGLNHARQRLRPRR